MHHQKKKLREIVRAPSNHPANPGYADSPKEFFVADTCRFDIIKSELFNYGHNINNVFFFLQLLVVMKLST